MAPVQRRPAAAGTHKSGGSPPGIHNLRVLQLEDDASHAELEARALSTAGFAVTCEWVDNEPAFTACLDSGSYDLILSDYSSSRFNAMRALQMLRARGLDVPFVLVTSALGEETAIECLKLGATDCVRKGHFDRLASVVERALRDADERRQRTHAEAALRQSEERYRSLVESAQEIIVTLALDGTITSVNSAFTRALGWPPGTWTGQHFAPLIHPDDRAAAEALFARAVRGETVPPFELRLHTAGGQYLVQEMTATVQRVGDRAARVLVVARDVTARKRAEIKMRTLVENAKDLSGTFDLGEMLARVVERTAKALPCDVVAMFGDGASLLDRLLAQYGLSPDLVAAAHELRFARGEPFGGLLQRGETIRIVDAEADASPYAALFRRFRLRSAVVTSVRSRGTHFGALVAATYSLYPFDRDQVDWCEAVARLIAGALDTTELQRAQREETQVASALARVGQELISSVDLPALLERLCRVTTEVLGCDVSYTLMLKEDRHTFVTVASFGESPAHDEVVRSISVPQQAFDSVVEQAARDEVVQFERTPHAHPLPPGLRDIPGLCAALAVPLRRRDELIGVHVAGNRADRGGFNALDRRIARGIAQLASLALENARLVQQLEDANRLKSDFLATVSHELRTPLNVILGYNDLIRDEVFGPVTADQHATLERIGSSARELLELIGATLDISRLETGRAALNLQEIDAVALLREVQTETHALREKPGVESIWRIDANLPRLYNDAVKIKVLLKNLIANAIKFTDRGSVTVAAAAHDSWVDFSVADTGIGMSKETLAVIFEPFRQADSSTTRRHGGVGLGLYIVSRLIGLLSGRIEVESTQGAGSTFRVRIPIDALRDARGAAKS